MTSERLRDFKNAVPFRPFSIHMNDGSKFDIKDPESLVVHKDWTMDAIVLLPRGRFSFVYLKNVTDVSGAGSLPKLGARRRRRGGDEGGL
jgi:hypothetical protein